MAQRKTIIFKYQKKSYKFYYSMLVSLYRGHPDFYKRYKSHGIAIHRVDFDIE